MSGGPKEPVCFDCPHNFWYNNVIPMRRQGVMMNAGEHFCLGGKKARRFKKHDPKIYVPGWCPKRKVPCELRVYTIKSTDDWWMHKFLERSIGRFVPPEGRRYALEQETVTEVSPQEFWKRLKQEDYRELLDLSLNSYDVVEIDDGLKPAFFYYVDGDFTALYGFGAAEAKAHKKGDCP